MSDNSIPDIEEFNPFVIPFQGKVVTALFSEYDYKLGCHEILLSGSVGSAKTILMAHVAATLSVMFPNNRILLCRKTLPALKETLLSTLIDHMGQKVTFKFNQSRGRVKLSNGSEILCHSWSDNKFKKVRSYNISSAFIEEGTENDKDEFYKEIVMRCGRLAHIPINLCVTATNPDSPAHWLYKHFIETESSTRHIFYSRTADNPFLPPEYIQKLRENLSPQEAERMLEGKWVEISKEVVYYNYTKERNYKDRSYIFNPHFPIDFMQDFNIGLGKPMSMAIGQFIDEHFHVARTIIVEGARTGDIMDELADTGILNHECNHFRVFGDASGRSKDTRNNKSDYDIIKNFLANYEREDKAPLMFEIKVPSANPELRSRHNLSNARFLNANGDIRFTIYKDAIEADRGFRLTKYKKGATLIEDDSLREQHVTTAITYWVHFIITKKPIQAASSD